MSLTDSTSGMYMPVAPAYGGGGFGGGGWGDGIWLILIVLFALGGGMGFGGFGGGFGGGYDFPWLLHGQNAINTKKLLDEKGITVRKAILCCQAFHARRSKLYYQILFPETEILVYPTVTKDISKENWFKTREKSDRVLGEVERCGSQFHEIVAEYGALEE